MQPLDASGPGKNRPATGPAPLLDSRLDTRPRWNRTGCSRDRPHTPAKPRDWAASKLLCERLMGTWPDFRMMWAVQDAYAAALEGLGK